MKACVRCGQPYIRMTGGCKMPCVHSVDYVRDMDSDHVQRIQAAYALGKRFNPDHDITSYFEQTRQPVTDFKERARSHGEEAPLSSAAFTATVGGAMVAPHLPITKD